ncbi:MAG: TetR/AcrR family transcriptional regulator [Desulfomonilia bacterium]
MKMPRSSAELERIRERIIEAALSILDEEGFYSLTMRRLATRLHMSAPNLYNFFKSKEEIYISLVIKGFQMLYDELKISWKSHDEPVSRARALIESYIRFGLGNKAYYDVMFIRATPKHNDYIGTPYEKLSAVEYRISMDIARLGMDTLMDMVKDRSHLTKDDVIHNIIKIWSMLHGMISLANSKIVGYVAPDVEKTYSRIIDEIIEQYRS